MTGLRPTGTLHIGNYFGALLPFLELQKTADSFFLMIADLHALTTIEDSKNLKQNSLDLITTFLAVGIDPQKTTIFAQSHIQDHAELANILGAVTPVSMVQLCPVYKDMCEQFSKNNNIGLLAYPVLQAADILLYKTTQVPVGKDQEAHIEITREIARRFNSRFGNILTEPKTILQEGAKVLSLQDPTKKMSKSHGSNSYIALLDSPADIRKKIKVAVTDSGSEVKFDISEKLAISNLLTIYSLFSGKSISEIEKVYKGKGYGDFKKDLAEVIVEGLAPIQEKYYELKKNPDFVMSVLKTGAERAKKISSKTMEEVREKIGFV